MGGRALTSAMGRGSSVENEGPRWRGGRLLFEAVVDRDEPAPLVEEVNDRVGVEVEGRAHPVVLRAWAGMSGQWQGREKKGAHGGHGGARTAPSMPLKSGVHWKPISLSSSLSG